MRRKARVDENQAAIVRALRSAGATVTPTHMVGKGFPDIAVGFRGKTYLLEIKDPTALRGKAQAMELTDDEARWHERWRGHVDVVTNEAEALKVILT